MPGRCCSPESCAGQDSGEKGGLCPSQTHSTHFQVLWVWVGGKDQVISQQECQEGWGWSTGILGTLAWAGLIWPGLG